jgi:predicted ATP-dependent serine protease
MSHEEWRCIDCDFVGTQSHGRCERCGSMALISEAVVERNEQKGGHMEIRQEEELAARTKMWEVFTRIGNVVVELLKEELKKEKERNQD